MKLTTLINFFKFTYLTNSIKQLFIIRCVYIKDTPISFGFLNQISETKIYLETTN